ncbi:MAG: adenylosuccinate lyase [Rhodanobacteraceae bacterium]|nr:adenylosuccinate lyase [Rhodanobacteraceae bacterium]
MTALTALSPLDGRYQRQTESLRPIFSEAGLIRRRVLVELRWLEALAAEPAIAEVPPLSTAAISFLRELGENFDAAKAGEVKAIEASTAHDVKAVEYWIKRQLQQHGELKAVAEFVHFACTSEDINNLAYALMLKDVRETVLVSALTRVLGGLRTVAQDTAELPMLSRTHGQTASPTTMGKEIRNVIARIERQFRQLEAQPLMGKINGAVGNFNAHLIAYPEVDWPALSRAFVESLGLVWNEHTTQIEPHDFVAELCDICSRLGTVLIDLCRDIWGYISVGYFRQAQVEGEVGSSTMPHKVNPIDFENAEGNFGLANALFGHFSEKLPISRFQRDLTDSTVMRSLGSAFGYLLIGLRSLERGLGKLRPDADRVAADLDGAWEVLAEAVQTVMRRYGLPQPYEQLKALTRGNRIEAQAMREFIEGLELPADAKQRLLDLTPGSYIGLAATLARRT